ncbi:hypothetical protein CPB83DRAFT_893899 [Crepidotus variabilis]|uniref:Uncharacterized protein n=1 Tax=Crepidotus variabilis TaxID=179855 RepID=A0A9P6EH35_9AGAR|nr:hypothetical protein CPB83DRAFT_893899 [Crepidotus variabilis]
MSNHSAPILETKIFRLEHSGKAIESNNSLLSFSEPSNSPTQLWSSCPSVNGQWIVNRGTGAYLVVENSTIAVKIEQPYEWNIQNEGSSVRLQADSVSQKMLLQTSQQKLTLSSHSDADSLFAFTYVAQPSLSVGSEDYIQSPEHTCVTNHVFNTVNALNTIIQILEHPDKAPPANKVNTPIALVPLFTRDHYKAFKARGQEATQNLEFARETVASWFTVIGAKLSEEVNKQGNIEGSIQNDNDGLQAAERQMKELEDTHAKTYTGLKDQQEKFNKFDADFKNAEAHFKEALKSEELTKIDYDNAKETPSIGGYINRLIGFDVYESVPLTVLRQVWLGKQAERQGTEAKKNSSEGERDREEGLLNTLKDQSARELADIAKIEANIIRAKSAAEDAARKAADYQNHHQTLTTLHGLFKDCREHLAGTLVYNIGGGASLSGVRKALQGVIDVLEKGDDFKEPLKILDRAALDHLMTHIPAITSHSNK